MPCRPFKDTDGCETAKSKYTASCCVDVVAYGSGVDEISVLKLKISDRGSNAGTSTSVCDSRHG